MISKISNLILIGIVALGCTSERKTQERVSPITYNLPVYRAHNSVGNLRRLAIAPVKISAPLTVHVSDNEKERFASSEAEQVASFLNYRKGYEVIVLLDGEPNWQRDPSMKISHINDAEVALRWFSSTSDEQEGLAAMEIGKKHAVDGVVSIWAERSGNPTFMEDLLAGLLTIGTFGLPIVYGITHESGRVVIYETATGLPIWSASCAVLACPTVVDKAAKLFVNIENALPAQLTK
jgi:hypothetical protein